MKTAKLLKDVSENFSGSAKLYKLSEPLEYDRFDEDGNEASHKAEFVIVSAASVLMTGPETYIFPATEDGEIENWLELDGSYRGGLCHETALENAGYSVA